MPSQEFNIAAEEVKKLEKRPSQPGFMDFTGRAKWSAWDSLKGLSQDEAEKQYIALVNNLKAADN